MRSTYGAATVAAARAAERPARGRLTGIVAALAVRDKHPETAVMVLSQYVEEQYATELVASRSTGVGYLLKDRVADTSDFIGALRDVAAGGTVLDPEVVTQLLTRARHADPLAALTPRETEVLRLALEGAPVARIAATLHLSPGTVRNHLSSAIGKTATTTKVEAARAAQSRGWL